jgi:hypothetical protein
MVFPHRMELSMTKPHGDQSADTRDINKPLVKGVASAFAIIVSLAVIIIRFTLTPEAVDPIIQLMGYLETELPSTWAFLTLLGLIATLMYVLISMAILGVPWSVILAQAYIGLFASSLMALLSAAGLPAVPNLIFGAIAIYIAYRVARLWNLD